jgi:two-component system cell cycle response regulator
MAKILIADDSRVQIHIFSAFLAAKGFTVAVAVDALQAWMSALREMPDAIVLDINMPAGSGIEVLRKLRMSIKTQHIPVVVVTGTSDPETERKARELGAAEFLHKPVEPGQLHAILARLLAPGEASTAP